MTYSSDLDRSPFDCVDAAASLGQLFKQTRPQPSCSSHAPTSNLCPNLCLQLNASSRQHEGPLRRHVLIILLSEKFRAFGGLFVLFGGGFYLARQIVSQRRARDLEAHRDRAHPGQQHPDDAPRASAR
ncbi:hypothetical protein FB451DRAFT_1415783 [Mycena latifolia]|nr:hypothetical protein FB451DRAFT_1415783 [Mycena latifolia]